MVSHPVCGTLSGGPRKHTQLARRHSFAEVLSSTHRLLTGALCSHVALLVLHRGWAEMVIFPCAGLRGGKEPMEQRDLEARVGGGPQA